MTTPNFRMLLVVNNESFLSSICYVVALFWDALIPHRFEECVPMIYFHHNRMMWWTGDNAHSQEEYPESTATSE